MPTINKKRKPFNLDELSSDEWYYFLLGHAFFDLDPTKIEEKWPIHRGKILELWFAFEPFDIGTRTYEKAEPGERPWAWWNLDHPEYKRKCIKGTPGEGPEHNNGIPGYYSGPSVYESQAVFLKRHGLLTDYEIRYFEHNEMPEKEKIL